MRLENKVKVSKTVSTFCHIKVLKSCKFGEEMLTHSENNVHLSIFGLNLAVSISHVTLKIRSRSPTIISFLSCPCIRFMRIWAKSADLI